MTAVSCQSMAQSLIGVSLIAHFVAATIMTNCMKGEGNIVFNCSAIAVQGNQSSVYITGSHL
eukprot:CAMPEP_0174309344 /NCGR_PEP_ID=MMETSP0810-20121108/2347_1 /TAXON_ID=73025 ORGANISM="Eutreptiella gymnastica-like, Strain CCMP1594" /NCGR_SAMPLE_ID=MMETSP0810 /ASSEMBLY_ACC=CAM_ASM_000659 /LENGTH=61 /DNA_ID=CAMNT_0015416945 /DNA_START=1477 /DNA_END=1659 /DNA_ORIENTATION=-